MELRKVVSFCDICEAPNAIEINVEIKGTWRRLDLCEKDARPIHDLLKHSEVVPPRGRVNTKKPMTLEDAQRQVMRAKRMSS